ncbi:hypothetical protein HBN50_13515 [Halobacteriovorax sp. GB3]|uniref:hypothetical protein n=1 Tax=Halobacteriovorax sp. GB3 TaxID=2719615 RepID=UPI0023612B12|nr:hypothetical protein [Halobacteriovorax sp. GB3]MDD0854125.1 hypothetical protein [Halobacteriovorax sp. GB3]
MQVRKFGEKTRITAIIFLLLTLMVSCGKKNVVSSSNSGNLSGYDPNVNTGGTVNSSEILSIINQVSCTQGTRLNNVYTYNTSASGTRTTLAGNFAEGPISGPLSKIFIGASIYGDVLAVAKVTNGSSVVGYNVFVSLCSYTPNNFPYVVNERTLSNFRAPYGIVLDEDNHCGYGSVDSAQMTRILNSGLEQYNGSYVGLSQTDIVTTFRKVNCN